MATYHCLTFLTDYGLEDGFVAACHGVALQIAPNARIIDITHLVAPGDLRRGAAVLAQTVPYLPKAVHVAVVDPGVGTPRRGIAMAVASGSLLIGPDNGVLSWAAADEGGVVSAVSLTNRDLWRSPSIPATFHGRDIFMPVAAHLAAGAPFDTAGEALDPASLVTLDRPGSQVSGTAASGEVITVDRFGNVQLSLTAATVLPLLAAAHGAEAATCVRLSWGEHAAEMTFGRTFGDVPPGELVAYPDSSGLVAIAVNGGDAAGRLSLRPGVRVTIAPKVLRRPDQTCLYPRVPDPLMAELTGFSPATTPATRVWGVMCQWATCPG